MTRGLFAVARRRDERARRKALARRLETIAAFWAERAGLTGGQAAVGNNPAAPIPAVLLGLRIGSCQLEIPCVVAGLDAAATITHDVMRGKGLRLVIRPRTPFVNSFWTLDQISRPGVTARNQLAAWTASSVRSNPSSFALRIGESL
jgi:hypothetical protein